MHAILKRAVERGRALAAQDWDVVAAQLHPEFLYVNANGDRLGREEYLAFLRDGPLRWRSQTLEDARVVEAGSTATLVATVVDDVVYDGEAAEWRLVTSQVYVRENGEWLYLAGHTALPAA